MSKKKSPKTKPTVRERGKQEAYFAVPPQAVALKSTEPIVVWGYDTEGNLLRLEMSRTSVKAFTGKTGSMVVGDWTWGSFLEQLQQPKTRAYKDRPMLKRDRS